MARTPAGALIVAEPAAAGLAGGQEASLPDAPRLPLAAWTGAAAGLAAWLAWPTWLTWPAWPARLTWAGWLTPA
jgi:hypothetical protein